MFHQLVLMFTLSALNQKNTNHLEHMSRIDNATLNLTLTKASTEAIRSDDDAANIVEPAGSGKVRVYATNYNVLRIMSGGWSRILQLILYLYIFFQILLKKKLYLIKSNTIIFLGVYIKL